MKRWAVAKTVVLAGLAVLALVVFFMCVGAGFLVEAPLRLLVGWIFFSAGNLTSLTVSWPGLATFIVLFVATMFVSHSLINSLRGDEKKISMRVSLAATALVVTLFVAGIGATGVAHQVGWLINSPEPLLDGGVGRAARRMSDWNNQKQVALGFYNHHSAHTNDNPIRRLTTLDDRGRLLHGWQTALLPFIEQQALHESIDHAASWNSARNRESMGTVIPTYTRHDDAPETSVVISGSYALSHLAANRLLMGDREIKRLKDISDGAANTVLFGSAAGEFLPWGHPQNWRSSEFVPNENPRGFGSGYKGGCHIAMADGSVIFISDSIDPELWKALFTPRGNESIAETWNP